MSWFMSWVMPWVEYSHLFSATNQLFLVDGIQLLEAGNSGTYDCGPVRIKVRPLKVKPYPIECLILDRLEIEPTLD